MAIDLNNTASVNLVTNTRLRQSSAPSEKPEFQQSSTINIAAQQEKIIPFDTAIRQNIALVDSASGSNPSSTENLKLSSDLSSSVSELSRAVQTIQRKLEFRIDDTSGRTVITVRDSKSDEVIRQIPSDQLLELSARLKEIESDKSTDPGIEAQGVLFTSKT